MVRYMTTLSSVQGKLTLILSKSVDEFCQSCIQAFWSIRNNSAYQAYCDELSSEDPIRVHRISHSAVCMGYDFHVQDEKPYLIEVNTNAFGLLSLPHSPSEVLSMFQSEWHNYDPKNPLKHIVIVEEDPETQISYPEFQAYQHLFQEAGIQCTICDPSALSITAQGDLMLSEQKIDMVYLRYCDFLLSNPSVSHLRRAYLNNRVCVTPSPREYHLLADKKRMITWSDPSILDAFDLEAEHKNRLITCVPRTELLSSQSIEIWKANRKKWVFKPTQLYGSKGVYVGKSISQTKLTTLEGNDYIAQQYIPPDVVWHEQADQQMKWDLRYYIYEDKILATGARLYQGQVTNFQSEHAALVPVSFM